MNFLFKGEIIDYQFIGGKTQTIVFLHGWGADKNAFFSTLNLLKSKFNILTLTLPTIKQTNFTWKLEDYANLVASILKLYNVTSISIVCHSFGFRVASVLTKYFDVNKIVVTGGAGLIANNVFKQIEMDNKKIFLHKWKFLYSAIASKDYINLPLTNKQTFKNIVNLNTLNLINFNCPLLLFWGKKDCETPLKHAKIIKKQNKSKLLTVEGGHFAYLQNNALFNNEVIKFLC